MCAVGFGILFRDKKDQFIVHLQDKMAVDLFQERLRTQQRFHDNDVGEALNEVFIERRAVNFLPVFAFADPELEVAFLVAQVRVMEP